jgi:hypothetical protein
VKGGYAFVPFPTAMDPDRKDLETADLIVATQKQLAGDMERLRKLWTNLQRTQDVLLRAASAYEASQQLLLQVESKKK